MSISGADAVEKKRGKPAVKKMRLGLERRPAYHYTPKSGWMSDPNGMVFHEGEYHFSYQNDNYNEIFKDMSWGHAVSKDLVHWEELPRIIQPTDDGFGMVFSGGTAVDHSNSAGFGKDAFLAYYTCSEPRQQQCMAYSTDQGRTYTKYENNPVIPNAEDSGIGDDFRDPKVTWNKYSEKWVISIAVNDVIEFWTSKDMKAWSKDSAFGKEHGAHEGFWECPDIIEMPIDGNMNETAWVLLVSINPGGPNGGSGTQYFVGDFKEIGGTMVFESFHKETKWLDYGTDNYAGVTFEGAPYAPIFAGWLSNWMYAGEIPTKPWRGVMTFPRDLKLKRIEDKLIVTSTPVEAINIITGDLIAGQEDIILNQNVWISDKLSSSRIQLELDLRQSSITGLELSNGIGQKTIIGYDCNDSAIYVDRTGSGEMDFNEKFASKRHDAKLRRPLEKLKIEILVDKTSIEVFVNDGEYVMTEAVFPTEPYSRFKIFTDNDVEVKNFTINEIERVMHEDELLL